MYGGRIAGEASYETFCEVCYHFGDAEPALRSNQGVGRQSILTTALVSLSSQCVWSSRLQRIAGLHTGVMRCFAISPASYRHYHSFLTKTFRLSTMLICSVRGKEEFWVIENFMRDNPNNS